MATTQQDGMTFGIAHEQQSFRLLELPADLLDLLNSPNPPRLSIKSTQPAQTPTQKTKPSYAVLCTPNKAYQLRQVQTSNSVFVTQPNTIVDTVGLPTDGVNAIAVCSATLELHPVTESATEYLVEALASWDGDSSHVDPSRSKRTKQEVFADVPLSDEACEASWTQLCAFENDGCCYRPTASVLSSTWHDVLEASVAESINLGSQFLVQEVWKAVDDQAMGSIPQPLLAALIRRLLPDGDSQDEGWACVDQSKCVPWVGTVNLEAKSGENILTADYLDLWRNNLPEKWRESAQLDIIKDSCIFPSSTTVGWKNGSVGAAGAIASNSPAPKAATGARKWHEKFKNTRR